MFWRNIREWSIKWNEFWSLSFFVGSSLFHSLLSSFVLCLLLSIFGGIVSCSVLLFFSNSFLLSLFNLSDGILSNGLFVFSLGSFHLFDSLKRDSFNCSLKFHSLLLLKFTLVRLLYLFVKTSPCSGPS